MNDEQAYQEMMQAKFRKTAEEYLSIYIPENETFPTEVREMWIAAFAHGFLCAVNRMADASEQMTN
jgi:hypothetical protein